MLRKLTRYLNEYIVFISVLSFFVMGCGTSRVSPSIHNEKEQERKDYVIDKAIDLEGKTVFIPEGGSLYFVEGGRILNGRIVGNNSRIKTPNDNSIGVRLSGTWNVKQINDGWFDRKVLSDNQIMDNLIALQRDDIIQQLTINNDYVVELSEKRPTAFAVYSNTELILNSTIAIKGNNLQRYNIISISNRENVKLKGGELIGDVGRHLYIEGSTSEWGFAVYINNSKNVAISDLKTSLCTGDGFYITGGEEQGVGQYEKASENIILRRCVLNDLRREGISLVHANGVLIEDCMAINMGQTEYTPPCFGINIEPNKNKSVKNVKIIRFKTVNSRPDYCFSSGGYQFDGLVSNRENIVLEDCIFDKGIGIMSGGVTVKNSSFKQIVLYTYNVPAGEPGTNTIDHCTIAGGNGIQFDGRKKLNSNYPTPKYIFRNCNISAEKVYRPIPGLIWGTDLDNICATLLFDNCKVFLQPHLKDNNIIAAGFNIDCRFTRCSIDASSYVLRPRGVFFENCTIHCLSVDNTRTANSFKSCDITFTKTR